MSAQPAVRNLQTGAISNAIRGVRQSLGMMLNRSGTAGRGCVRSTMEALDPRQLMSVDFSNGALVVNGTAGDDKILISLNATDRSLLNVNDNGVVTRYPIAAIKSISVNGFTGNDLIQVSDAKGVVQKGVYFGGGKGDDTLIGSSAGDYLRGGQDNDLLLGRLGPDTLAGGLGDDRIDGDRGNDSITGGDGNDAVTGGAGTNFTDLGTGQTSIQQVFTIAPPKILLGSTSSQPNAFLGTVTGLDPAQVRRAYEFGSLSDPSNTNRGAGQVIAIVNAFQSPTLLSDLSVFSQTFGLPLPNSSNVEIVYQRGRAPAFEQGWATEASLDLQWSHAIAPAAKKLMYFADSNINLDIYNTIQLAAARVSSLGGGVVSMSLGRQEFAGDTTLDSIFAAYPNVTFVAASGDDAGILSFPSTSPNVLSVGGTNLPVDSEGNRIGEESAWTAGGGGESGVFTVPDYQSGLINPDTGGLLAGRGSPDVAYNADPATGVAVYTGFNIDGNSGWLPGGVGGTSAGAPQWAALIALANERRATNGLAPLGNGIHSALYALRGNSNVLRDVTEGAQVIGEGIAAVTVHRAAVGYDLATGIGTPRATNLITALGSAQLVGGLNTDFTWTGQFFSPGDDIADNLTERNPLYGEPRGGTGHAAGNSRIDLSFSSIPNKYTNLGQAIFDTIQFDDLYRSDDGRVYGFGTANINDEDDVAEAWDTVVMTLQFEGRITLDGEGREHISGDFYAIDPSTGDRIPKSPFQRRGGVGPTLGTYFEGSLEG